MVQGPYLVRSAAYDKDKKALHLEGDEAETQSITVFAPAKLCSITWNGAKVPIVSRNGNLFVISVEGPAEYKLPDLGPWTWTDGLPEIESNYDAGSDAWVGMYI